MAKSAVEAAIWDLYAKEQGIPLAQALGGEKKEITVGISLGIEENTNVLLGSIEGYLKQGFKKLKLKLSLEKISKYYVQSVIVLVIFL